MMHGQVETVKANVVDNDAGSSRNGQDKGASKGAKGKGKTGRGWTRKHV